MLRWVGVTKVENEVSRNPNGVVITQPRVGVATPTLGRLHLGPTLKGLKRVKSNCGEGLLQLFQSWA